MFGSLGAPELIVIFVVALVVFGPSKLPELGKSLGEAIRGFKKAVSDPEQTPIENSETKAKPEKVTRP
ncbi:MAG: sec-independent protein translocase protein TatA [Candidatus Binatota bacterium]|jgi:sec-independent protein translocase protein TatA|nr:sec-independent protein translocase protein TatA [Candidatus Binatota bacterium]